MKTFGIPQELSKCDRETQGEQMLLEKWRQYTSLTQGFHKPSICKKKNTVHVKKKRAMPVFHDVSLLLLSGGSALFHQIQRAQDFFCSLILMKSHLFIHSFIHSFIYFLVAAISKKPRPNPKLWRFTPKFSSKGFIVVVLNVGLRSILS